MTVAQSRKKQFGDIFVDVIQWEEKTKLDPATGCINWLGALHPQFYGMCMVWDTETGKKKMATTHRVAYKMAVNSNITRKDFVIQKCCNHRCVNPLHLTLGSNSGDSTRIRKAAGKYIKRMSRYAHKQSQTRQYNYTVEQLIYAKHHTNKETVEHFNVALKDVNQMRDYLHPVRGFKWLKLIEHKYSTDGKMLPGYKPELAVEFQIKGKK
jgi:hypothetical protein